MRCMARKLIEDNIDYKDLRIAVFPTKDSGLPLHYCLLGQPVIVSPFNIKIHDVDMSCVVALKEKGVTLTYRCTFSWDKIMAVDVCDDYFINTMIVAPVTFIIMEDGQASFTDLMKVEFEKEFTKSVDKNSAHKLTLILGGK